MNEWFRETFLKEQNEQHSEYAKVSNSFAVILYC